MLLWELGKGHFAEVEIICGNEATVLNYMEEGKMGLGYQYEFALKF